MGNLISKNYLYCLKKNTKNLKNSILKSFDFKEAFSLIELLVVIAILGVLSAIAIPFYKTYQENAKRAVDESVLRDGWRTVQINQSLGLITTSKDLSEKVKSKGKKTKYWIINPHRIEEETAVWCLAINKQDDAISLEGGTQKPVCIDYNGVITRRTPSDVTCSDSIFKDKESCEKVGCNWQPSIDPTVSDCLKKIGSCHSLRNACA